MKNTPDTSKKGTTKKKKEFSKRIFVGVSVLTSAVVIFSFYMMWETKDLSPLSYLIPSTFTAFSAAIAFYFNKAKVENKIKLKSAFKMPLKDSDFEEDSTTEDWGG